MGRTWRIGEVSERTGLTRRTLRHYDDRGLLIPSGRSSGDYRLYDEADLLRLLQIQNLKAIGLGLAEIADVLGDPTLDATATLTSHLAHLEEQIAAEERLASRLRTLASTEQRSWDDVLDVIALTGLHGHGDPMLRLRAALDPRARSTAELLASLLGEADPAVQEVLVWALAQHPDAATAALAALPTADAERRRLLVRLLGKTRDPVSVPALLPLLADPDPRVVGTTVGALASIGAPAAAARLVGLIGSPDVPEADLLDAVVATGAAAIEPLAIAATADRPEVRAATAEALGRLTVNSPPELGRRIHPMLTGLLADPDPQVRLAALLALGEGADRPTIEAALDDPALAPLARRLLDLHAT